jgi:hypothetical protein
MRQKIFFYSSKQDLLCVFCDLLCVFCVIAISQSFAKQSHKVSQSIHTMLQEKNSTLKKELTKKE